MATDFDLDTYPLETRTRFRHGLGTKVDRLSDKSVRARVITTNKPIQIQCVFCPQTEAESAAFLDYLEANAATEFNIPHNGKTYRGFIDGDTLDNTPSHGVIHWWVFTFEGNLV